MDCAGLWRAHHPHYERGSAQILLFGKAVGKNKKHPLGKEKGEKKQKKKSMLKQELKKILRQHIQELVPQFPPLEIKVEEPPEGMESDLSSNAAFLLVPHLGKPPPQIAQILAERISREPVLRNVEATKKGFLNFTFADSYLTKNLLFICAQKKLLGKKEENSSKQILLEFVSANPTGPLHIGHGRGAALGDSLARIYRQLGYSVVREYYVNDIGVQMEMLAESVKARTLQLQGEKNVSFPEAGYQGNYIHEIAKEMMEQNRQDFEHYPKEKILQQIKEDLEKFRVQFDQWFFESDLHRQGKVDAVIQLLESKKCVTEKDGALWFVGKEPATSQETKLDKERVLKKSDGKWTYFASDIAYHKNKLERKFHSYINIWGSDHHGYVPRIKAALTALGEDVRRLQILLYQLVSLKRSGKRIAMSTRSGTFVTLREIVEEVGVDACRFFYSMRNPNAQFEFDLDLAKKKSQENPVYYVQYAHARICSIYREAEKRGLTVSPENEKVSLSLLKLPEERSLIKKLCFFPDLLESSVELSSPHLIPDYLIDCARNFHKFYEQHRVLDAERELCAARLVLLSATRIVLRTGLSLLGVSAPEKMN